MTRQKKKIMSHMNTSVPGFVKMMSHMNKTRHKNQMSRMSQMEHTRQGRNP
jgi:hypothetical protein